MLSSVALRVVDEALPTGGPEQLDPERSVYLRLRLHAGMPEGLTISRRSAAHHGGGEASLEDAWVICEAMQEVEPPEGWRGAQAGFRTTWAEAEGEGEESPLTAHVISWLEVGAEVQVVQPDLSVSPWSMRAPSGCSWCGLTPTSRSWASTPSSRPCPGGRPRDGGRLLHGTKFRSPFGGFEMDQRTANSGSELPGQGALMSRRPALYELVAPHAPLMSAHMGAFDEPHLRD